MKRLLASTLTFGVTGVFALCDLCGPSPAPAATRGARASIAGAALPPPRAVADTTVVFDVVGMTCGGCVIGVRAALARLGGVRGSVVTYEPPRAVVTFDPRRVSVAGIAAAIRKLGYTARPTTAAPQRPRTGT
jgi:copper chaperone CopZ